MANQHSLGLPSETFQLGMHMIRGLGERAANTLHNRFQSQFLPALPTSRTSGFTRREFGGLPGIGHPYWKTARAHAESGGIPPSLHLEISSKANDPSDVQISQTLQILREEWTSVPNVSLFSPLWIAARVFQVNSQNPPTCLLCIPVKAKEPRYYQNGKPFISGFTSYHGTREQLIRNILHQGLLASPPSHEQIGVWTSARREAALNWTPTAFDLLPTLALELESHPEAVFTNSKVQSGDPDRFVIRPEVFEARPALRIKAIWMGIPSWNRMSWHVTIKKATTSHFPMYFQPSPQSQFRR